MASKEKVDIKRSDQFQEMDEELTKAMEELDSTIDRVSLLFQTEQRDAGPASALEAGLDAPALVEEQLEERAAESPAPERESAAE